MHEFDHDQTRKEYQDQDCVIEELYMKIEGQKKTINKEYFKVVGKAKTKYKTA